MAPTKVQRDKFISCIRDQDEAELRILLAKHPQLMSCISDVPITTDDNDMNVYALEFSVEKGNLAMVSALCYLVPADKLREQVVNKCLQRAVKAGQYDIVVLFMRHYELQRKDISKHVRTTIRLGDVSLYNLLCNKMGYNTDDKATFLKMMELRSMKKSRKLFSEKANEILEAVSNPKPSCHYYSSTPPY